MLLNSPARPIVPPAPPRTIRLGGVTLDCPVILAPMSGVTDPPFRRMVSKFGAGLTVTEMIASKAMIRECRKTRAMSRRADCKGPVAVQLAGNDPAVMAEAAKAVEDSGAADIIDLNFGCPVKKIVSGQAGSYLMRDERLSAKILEAAVKAVTLPVTLKMRLGWDEASRNAPRLATIAEASGIAMVTVHARTRDQFYGGAADWAFLRRIKAATALPLIVNGDICDATDMSRALALSGADGVMIGRGTYGRPWLIGQTMAYWRNGVALEPPDLAAQYETVLEHFQAMRAYYGAHAGNRVARKHLAWYTHGLPDAEAFRRRINGSDDAAATMEAIRRYYEPMLAHASTGAR